MKIKNLIYKGLAVVAIALTASCSEDYLEKSPEGLISEGTVSGVLEQYPENTMSLLAGVQKALYDGDKFTTQHDEGGIAAMKLVSDLNCEDVAYFYDQHYFCWDYQLDNRLGSYRRAGSMWNQLYNVIQMCNEIIAKLKPAEGEEVSEGFAAAYGEAHGLRAYAYFWLINLWQHPYSVNPEAPGVPIKTEEVYRPERCSVKDVYALILEDIDIAYKCLEGRGYHSGDKVSMSEYAAAAIYANVLMFTGDYENAAKYAELAIAGGSLNSEEEMLSGFNSLDMSEVIWGYNVINETSMFYASQMAHIDAYCIGYAGMGFKKLIASDLLSHIDENDIRRQWFGYNPQYNTVYENSFAVENYYGLTDYIQNKFRDVSTMGKGETFNSAVIYTRIAEMFFVAAEAYYLAGNEAAAKEMLKQIMVSRNPAYTCDLSGEELYNEICIQKRIETWLEGCRYFDAKRRNETMDRNASENHSYTAVVYFNTGEYTGHDYRMIYRIPQKELETNTSIGPEDDNE
ncbi:MAG: RagB/SusD family nutrient uptake outer membrane protein [Bacteroidaceae bacterium]|nr:RagB/SusD family nutrient uptake outer membrane protein [Bacteroidaceae bacterium]